MTRPDTPGHTFKTPSGTGDALYGRINVGTSIADNHSGGPFAAIVFRDETYKDVEWNRREARDGGGPPINKIFLL